MSHVHLTPLEGIPKRLTPDTENTGRSLDGRKPDWRFSVLADFEELIRSYGQDHVSLK